MEEYFGYEKWKEATSLFLELKEKTNGRLMVIRYEDLHENTLELAESIFAHCGLELTDTTTSFIRNSQAKLVEDPNSIYRKGHKYDAWRSRLDPQVIEVIEKELKGTGLADFLM